MLLDKTKQLYTIKVHKQRSYVVSEGVRIQFYVFGCMVINNFTKRPMLLSEIHPSSLISNRWMEEILTSKLIYFTSIQDFYSHLNAAESILLVPIIAWFNITVTSNRNSPIRLLAFPRPALPPLLSDCGFLRNWMAIFPRTVAIAYVSLGIHF